MTAGGFAELEIAHGCGLQGPSSAMERNYQPWGENLYSEGASPPYPGRLGRLVSLATLIEIKKNFGAENCSCLVFVHIPRIPPTEAEIVNFHLLNY